MSTKVEQTDSEKDAEIKQLRGDFRRMQRCNDVLCDQLEEAKELLLAATEESFNIQMSKVPLHHRIEELIDE